jgi:hypothetical protein
LGCGATIPSHAAFRDGFAPILTRVLYQNYSLIFIGIFSIRAIGVTLGPLSHVECGGAFSMELKTMPSAATRDLARRLLADEAAADKTSLSTESAVLRVYEKLRWNLCSLAGVAGFRSLASRALTLAKSEAPSLSAIQIAADGSLQGLGEAESQSSKHQADEGGVILLAQLLSLLITFIGEALTLRLVRDTWPDVA